MKIQFHKYQGAGNDFILVDNRQLQWQPDQHEIRRLCDRHFGVGADGLMLLNREPGYDFAMIYYNADGRESTMCGNGGRCMMAFSRELGMAGSTFRFLAIDGPHEGMLKDGSTDIYRLKMKEVEQLTRFDDGIHLDTGSPHFVVFVEDAARVDVHTNGHRLRHDPRFAPGGVNVNFVETIEGGLFVRTYERGVEGETLSCGTGVTAAAIAWAAGQPDSNLAVRINTYGGELLVSFMKTGVRFRSVWLEGPASKVFQGTYGGFDG